MYKHNFLRALLAVTSLSLSSLVHAAVDPTDRFLQDQAIKIHADNCVACQSTLDFAVFGMGLLFHSPYVFAGPPTKIRVTNPRTGRTAAISYASDVRVNLRPPFVRLTLYVNTTVTQGLTGPTVGGRLQGFNMDWGDLGTAYHDFVRTRQLNQDPGIDSVTGQGQPAMPTTVPTSSAPAINPYGYEFNFTQAELDAIAAGVGGESNSLGEPFIGFGDGPVTETFRIGGGYGDSSNW